MMWSQRRILSSGRGNRPIRRGAGLLTCGLASLACVLAAIALLGPAASGAAAASGSASGGAGLDAFGEALITALGAARAERAVDAIGHGLALSEAQKQIAATERKLVREEATAAEAEAESTVVEEVKDPSEMPPASAGSNGTQVPHSGGGRLFAHTRVGDSASTAILLSGIALAPPDAPEAVQKVINAANTIVGRPYIWGGGHASFYSYGYDCSGSVSFALFGGGLIPEPLTSGSLEGWGEPGPGKWITVYANAGHTFMEIAGLRWDTVGDARGTGPRWHLEPNSSAGFVVRHPPGL
jgi:cell wall-associated NlpC family hydrolase